MKIKMLALVLYKPSNASRHASTEGWSSQRSLAKEGVAGMVISVNGNMVVRHSPVLWSSSN